MQPVCASTASVIHLNDDFEHTHLARILQNSQNSGDSVSSLLRTYQHKQHNERSRDCTMLKQKAKSKRNLVRCLFSLKILFP
jgi:hypothetical protein